MTVLEHVAAERDVAVGRLARMQRIDFFAAGWSMFALWVGLAGSAAASGINSLVPQPRSIRPATGSCTLPRVVRSVPQAEGALRWLSEGVGAFGAGEGVPALRFELVPQPELGAEGYVLDVAPHAVMLRAQGAAGFFHGTVTLRQLLPIGAVTNAAFGRAARPMAASSSSRDRSHSPQLSSLP